MFKKITFVTGNKGKVNELQKFLHIDVIQKDIDLPEVQSLNLQEIIEEKAREAYKKIHASVVVEDTSLVFHTLGKLPGPLIKWFLKELDNKGICNLMKQYKDKRATAQNIIGLFDGNKMMFFTGVMKGTISNEPKGNNGFGWDPIFVPDGQSKTFGEMTNEEKIKFSFRKLAVEKLNKYLSK